jgi:hypothetical protein
MTRTVHALSGTLMVVASPRRARTR